MAAERFQSDVLDMVYSPLALEDEQNLPSRFDPT